MEHGGIISQAERELFASYQMELAPTDRQRSFIQKFYLYLNLTKPSQKLFLTWFRVNQEGKESRKSYLVESIRHIFPEFLPEQLQDSGGESLMQDQAELSQIVTPKSSRKYFAEGLKRAKKGDFSPEWMGLYQWYMGQEQWRDQILPFLEAAFYQYQGRNMGERVTRALYGSVLEIVSPGWNSSVLVHAAIFCSMVLSSKSAASVSLLQWIWEQCFMRC